MKKVFRARRLAEGKTRERAVDEKGGTKLKRGKQDFSCGTWAKRSRIRIDARREQGLGLPIAERVKALAKLRGAKENQMEAQRYRGEEFVQEGGAVLLQRGVESCWNVGVVARRREARCGLRGKVRPVAFHKRSSLNETCVSGYVSPGS